MEAHEGILLGVVILSGNLRLIHIRRNGVVDIKQGHRILAYDGSDELTQRTVDIHLAGYRNAALSQTAVHIAGHAAELGLECGPAFSGNNHMLPAALMLLDPVEQSEFILSQSGKDFRLLVSGAKLRFHIRNHGRDSLVSRMIVEGLKQIQLGIFLDLNAQVEELLDGRVAGHEISRTGTEGNDLQAVKADDRSGDGREIRDHIRAFLRRSYRIFRNIGLQISQFQVVACVQHAAVGVSSAAHQVVSGLLRRGNHHGGAVKLLNQQGFGRFRSEVSKVNHDRVAARSLHIREGLPHIDFILDADRALIQSLSILLCIGCDYSFSSGHRQVHGKAVAAHRNDGNFFFRHVVHNFFLSAALRPPSVDIFSAQRSRSFTQRFSPFRPRWLPSGSPPSGWPISHLFFAVSSRSSPPA